MFDFIIDMSDVCWGVIDTTEKNFITIKKEEWAPGIWAGAERGWVKIVNSESRITGIYLIISVDLENRKIGINNLANNLQPGDLIYPHVVSNG